MVLRGLTFLGDALAHGVVPGWRWPSCGASAPRRRLRGRPGHERGGDAGGRRARVREDTGIGLLFVGMLALGVVIISRSDSFATDVTSLLFGDVLGVTTADLRGQASACRVVVVRSTVLYRPFLALTFNEDKAATLGLRPGLAHVALLALLATAIVASFQAIGTLLVFGLLIGPAGHRRPAGPAGAAGHAHRRGPGALAVVAGLALSYHHGTAGGATIAGLAVAEFFVVLAAQEATRPCAAPAPPRSEGGAVPGR